jgi:hypothetical protein
MNKYLAKLDDCLAKSPTVMVVDKKTKNKTIFGKNRGILKPSWAFVETNKTQLGFRRDQY